MSVLAQRAQTKIPASREFNAGAAVIARIILANGALARRSQIAGGAFALPPVLENLGAVIGHVYVVLHFVMIEQLLLAGSAVPTGIRQTCQRAALGDAETIVGLPAVGQM